MFCFYLISLSYFYLLRYFSLSIILQQRSNLRHCPSYMTLTVCFFHLKMVFSQDVCTLGWTYNKVIKPDWGNTFSLWPSPCQQIPFSAHFRAPWKNHYQSLTIELPFLNLAPLNLQMLFSLYCEILFTWAPIIFLLLLKSLLNLLQYRFYFILLFWVFFFWEACGNPAPWPGIEPPTPALEGKILMTGPPGKSCQVFLFMEILIVMDWYVSFFFFNRTELLRYIHILHDSSV